MMPQGLNEAIVAIRFIQTIEILRDELDSAWLERIHQKLFREMFRLMAPQAVAIHTSAAGRSLQSVLWAWPCTIRK